MEILTDAEKERIKQDAIHELARRQYLAELNAVIATDGTSVSAANREAEECAAAIKRLKPDLEVVPNEQALEN